MNTVSPGLLLTVRVIAEVVDPLTSPLQDWSAGFKQEQIDRVKSASALKALSRVEDVADLVITLVRSQSITVKSSLGTLDGRSLPLQGQDFEVSAGMGL